MKGIILAGGSGTRLYPITKVVSKQLMLVYDKPMIYYPISVLMLAGIRQMMIITTSKDIPLFKELLGDGSRFGLCLEYAVQPEPKGLAEAFLIAEDFLAGSPSCLILGDNFFYGGGLTGLLQQVSIQNEREGAVIFSQKVKDPQRFGVVEVASDQQVVSLEEKPQSPKSNDAVTGLYFYDSTVVSKAKSIKPSSRGELEITDLNNLYLREKKLYCIQLPRGVTWLDTGTFDSLIESASFVKTLQDRQGNLIACLEEIAFRKGWIDRFQLQKSASLLSNTPYGAYLTSLNLNEN